MVMHVISGLATGGAETTLVNLSCELQRNGMRQHVVSVGHQGAYGAQLQSAGVALSTLNVSAQHQAPAGLFRLACLLHRHRPDVVQGWMYHGNLMSALAHRLAPGRAGRRLSWNLRASNMDASRYARVIRWGAALSAWPDLVIANSEAGAAFHAAQGYRPRRSKVIANGIDVRKFRPDIAARKALRAEMNIADDAVVVLHAARVDPMKDHATGLSALAAVPHVVGLLVGAQTDKLQAPSNVRALGLRHDMERIYAMADVVLSSSAFGEGFSNAVAEGMSAGLVPVATAVGDAQLIVGSTGYVVGPGDPAALAAAIAEVAAASPGDRTARGLAARARIAEQFALDRTTEIYKDLYLSLSGRAGQAAA
jgi:glycosyltransferase involved in cell wall biosynthesis